MRSLILNLAALPAVIALQGCQGDDRRDGTADLIDGDHASVRATNQADGGQLRDGFFLAEGISLVNMSHLDIDDAPHETWSYLLSSDKSDDEIEAIFKKQAEAAGYALSFDSDEGFAASAPGGRELSLIMLEIDGDRSIQLLFSQPNRDQPSS